MEQIRGFGFLLFSFVNKGMFTVKELNGKESIKKQAGMIGPPFETVKGSESPEETINRLIIEEIGVPIEQVIICNILEQKFRLIPGRPEIFTSYGYGIFLGDPKQKFKPTDTDIVFAGWRNPAELREEFIRIETLPILDHFNKCGHRTAMMDKMEEIAIQQR